MFVSPFIPVSVIIKFFFIYTYKEKDLGCKCMNTVIYIVAEREIKKEGKGETSVVNLLF